MVLNNPLFVARNSRSASYQIEQSLRFDGGSYLTRTNGSAPSNQYKATFSVWVKVDGRKVDTDNYILQNGVSGTPYSNAALYYETNSGTGYNFVISNNSNPSTRTPAKGSRDHSAWYHLVFTFDHTQSTSANGMKIYVNGQQRNGPSFGGETAGGFSDAQNQPLSFLINGRTLGMGRSHQSSNAYFAGYMAEFHCVDGQVLSPTDFGKYDDNGVWRPIEYTGTHGNNGWYLKYDPSATNGIGHDHSGNGNNWTPTNFTTSGVDTDVTADTPTNNHCTWNGVAPSSGSLSDGNRTGSMTGRCFGTLGVSSGKWYWECKYNAGNSFAVAQGAVVVSSGDPTNAFGNGVIWYSGVSDGRYGSDYGTYVMGSFSNYGGTWWTGTNTFGMALDLDSAQNTMTFYRNGTSYGAVNIPSGHTWAPIYSSGSGSSTGSFTLYIDENTWTYTPPTGFKALNTANLPAPDIADGSDGFETVLDTGSNIRSSAQSTFSDGLWWIKDRANSNQHQVIDSQRGTTTRWDMPGNTAQTTYSAPSGNSVAWCWSAPNSWSNSSGTNGATIASAGYRNLNTGFSIAQYTGDRPNTIRVAHGLNTAPDFIITRYLLANSYSPFVYHKDTGTNYGNWLDGTFGGSSSSDYAVVNSQYIEHGNTATCNETGTNGMIMYSWSAVPGYSAFGKYSGNSSTDGPFIYTGFRPKWIITRGLYTSGAPSDYNWRILDTDRDTYNGAWHMLWSNKTDYEAQNVDSNNAIDLLSNGFKIRTSSVEVNNSSGPQYIWAAFAENPFGGDGVSPATAR